jgi:hypothetical protein
MGCCRLVLEILGFWGGGLGLVLNGPSNVASVSLVSAQVLCDIFRHDVVYPVGLTSIRAVVYEALNTITLSFKLWMGGAGAGLNLSVNPRLACAVALLGPALSSTLTSFFMVAVY